MKQFTSIDANCNCERPLIAAFSVVQIFVKADPAVCTDEREKKLKGDTTLCGLISRLDCPGMLSGNVDPNLGLQETLFQSFSPDECEYL